MKYFLSEASLLKTLDSPRCKQRTWWTPCTSKNLLAIKEQVQNIKGSQLKMGN